MLQAIVSSWWWANSECGLQLSCNSRYCGDLEAGDVIPVRRSDNECVGVGEGGAVRRDTTAVTNGFPVVSDRAAGHGSRVKKRVNTSFQYISSGRVDGPNLVSIEEVDARCRGERTESSQQASGLGNESKGGSDKAKMKPHEEGRQSNV